MRLKNYDNEQRPALSWVNTHVSYGGPPILRVRSGILQGEAEVEKFITELRAWVDTGKKR